MSGFITPNILWDLAIVCLVIATLTGIFPLWRSRSLSPDVIMRRTYWVCTVLTMLFAFLAVWPEWPAGLFASSAIGLTLVVFAGRYTRHIKIRGKVYGMPGTNVPDRPPSRAPKD
ncbi:hypothetical protein [Mycolicibacterium confluentis]|uniref:Uncharacterized protein n=1 Tax=Mycolicibacterium confluentis TaxID=28047 RepID=A0A7I7Y1D8_9MYCO|nr:hypothetical protein [Mycolicibacterium confluentis]MCV7320431.1 hypothetical protein [Mycolicibacterium confluentis]ORV21849.1 hypothetical protein AWB99_05765 [Mycolicibacterium confluentis]BBZ35470.1 hypothetical protein MCNF_40750 [Mycolicibacterium confluentis]